MNRLIFFIFSVLCQKQVKHCKFLSNGDFSNINFDKKEMIARINKRLHKIVEEYRTTIVNFSKYKLVTYTMAKIIELEIGEQNRVVLYLVNSVKSKK